MRGIAPPTPPPPVPRPPLGPSSPAAALLLPVQHFLCPSLCLAEAVAGREALPGEAVGALLEGARECDDAGARLLAVEAAAFGGPGGAGLRRQLVGALGGTTLVGPAELAALLQGALGSPVALGCLPARQEGGFISRADVHAGTGEGSEQRGAGWEEGLCDSLRRSDPAVRRAAADAAALHLSALLTADPAGPVAAEDNPATPNRAAHGATAGPWDFAEQQECLRLLFSPPEDEADLWRMGAAAAVIRRALRSEAARGHGVAGTGGKDAIEAGVVPGARAFRRSVEVLEMAARALLTPGFVEYAAESSDRAASAETLTAFSLAALRSGENFSSPAAASALQAVARRLLLWSGPRAPPGLASAAALGLLELAAEWPGAGGDGMAAAGVEALLALLREPALRGFSGQTALGAARGAALVAARGFGGSRLSMRLLSQALSHVMASTAMEPASRAAAFAFLARGAFLWELRPPASFSAEGPGSPASPSSSPSGGVLQSLLLHRALSEGSHLAVLGGGLGQEARLVFLRTALAACPVEPAEAGSHGRWRAAATKTLRWAAPACFESPACTGELCLLTTLAAAALAGDGATGGGDGASFHSFGETDSPEALLREWLAPDQAMSLEARLQVVFLAAAYSPAEDLEAAASTLSTAGAEMGLRAGKTASGGAGPEVELASVLEPLRRQTGDRKSSAKDEEALWGEWAECAEALACAIVAAGEGRAGAHALSSLKLALDEVVAAQGEGAGRTAAEGVLASLDLSAALTRGGRDSECSSQRRCANYNGALTELFRGDECSWHGTGRAEAAEDRCLRAVQSAGKFVTAAVAAMTTATPRAVGVPRGRSWEGVTSGAANVVLSAPSKGADGPGGRKPTVESTATAQLTVFWPEGVLMVEVTAAPARQLPPSVSGLGAFDGIEVPGPFPLSCRPGSAQFAIPIGEGLTPRGFHLHNTSPNAGMPECVKASTVVVPLRLLCRPSTDVPPLAPNEFGRVWNRLPYRTRLDPEGVPAGLTAEGLSALAVRLTVPASPWAAEQPLREVAPGLWRGLYRALSCAGGWILFALSAENAGREQELMGLRAELVAKEPLGSWSAADWDALILGGLLGAGGGQRLAMATRHTRASSRSPLDLLPPVAGAGLGFGRSEGALRAACAVAHRDARAVAAQAPGGGATGLL